MNKKYSSPTGAALIWLGASLSVSGIFSGASISVLSTLKGTAAILIGNLTGCGLLFLTARIASSLKNSSLFSQVPPSRSGRIQKPGVLLFFLFTSLFFIVRGALTLRTASLCAAMAFGPTAPGTLLTDKIMLTPASYLFLAVILLLILLRFSFPSEKTGIFRNIFIALTAGITLLLCGILLFCAGRFSAPEFPAAAEFSGFRLSFGEAAELSSAAALSWIPVFFLFSLHNQSSVAADGVGAGIHFTGGCSLQIVSFLFVRHARIPGLEEALGLPAVKLFGILFILLSAVISVCLFLFSAGKSSATIYCSRINEKTAVLISLSAAVLTAVFFPTGHLENAVRFLSAFFVPFLGVLTAGCLGRYCLQRISGNSGRLSADSSYLLKRDILGIFLCLAGFLILRHIEHQSTLAGLTLPFFLIFTLFCTAVQTVFDYRQADGNNLKEAVQTYLKHRKAGEKKYHENRSEKHPALCCHGQERAEKQNAAPSCGRGDPGRSHHGSAAGEDTD
ncbi:MAG: hypothetical protein ACLVAI_02595 [Anaerovoracaceae bacterium]